jgi:HK97 family phage portal protein
VSLFSRPQRREFVGITGAEDLIPSRTGGGARQAGSVVVTDEKARRHSAVWAALDLRAGLISSFPVDVFRKIEGLAVEMPRPPILTDPGGAQWDYADWMYATQRDLDSGGNAIGLIVERNALGLPARIELQHLGSCAVIRRKGELKYRIGGTEYDPPDVWHERQYVMAGLDVGLSPITYAAYVIGEYLSLQQYGLDWFGAGGVPKARMRNTAKRLSPGEIRTAKQWYADTVRNGDLLVTGNDWEYDMIQAETAGMEWLDGRQATHVDVARFLGVPADLIDAAVSGQSITYANITQRNLQFLIMKLGPAVQRREKALSKLLPRPRYVKLNTDALLRMDPETRQKVQASRLKWRILTNTEARALENLPALTDEQLAETDRIYGPPKGTAPSGAGEGDDDEEMPAATEVAV